MDSKKNWNKHNFIKKYSIADNLRDTVDSWNFKQYILGIFFIDIFLKILLTILIQINAKSDTSFYYAKLDEIIDTKGYFIYPNQFFNVYK